MISVPVVTGNGSIYATCDGIPRYAGYVQYASMVNSSISATASTVYGIATSTSGSFSNPAPSCIIPQTQCDSLVSSWHATNYLAFPFNSSTGLHSSWPNGPPTDFPHCNASYADYTSWANDTWLYSDGSGCWLKGAAARLFYWPEPRQEGNQLCPDGTWTIPSAPTSPANATALVTKVVTLSETYYDYPPTTVTMTSPTMYLSIQDLEARDASWGFAGAPIPATVIAVAPGDLMSMIIAPPLITNEALSSSAMSVIAHREVEKYTDLFGYDWQQHQDGVGGPNLPLQTVAVNPADLGRPPQPLSYYFGAAGWHCLNADPIAFHDQPVSAGLPPAMPCDTIFDDFYAPWVQIPATARSREGVETCNLMFGWDPPVALTAAVTAAGPGKASVTLTTSDQAVGSTSAAPGSEVVRGSSTPTAGAEPVTSTVEGSVAQSNGASESSGAQSLAQTSVPDSGSPSAGEAFSQAQPLGQTTAADSGPSAGGDLGQSPDQTTVAGSGASTDGDPGAASSAGSGASTGSPGQPADPSPAQGNPDGGAAMTTAGATPVGSAPDSDPSSQGSSGRTIATIGSGSSAVTLVSDPSSSGQVIAVSSGGSVTFSAGQQSTIGTQQVSVNGQGQVIVSSATTINFALSQAAATRAGPASASQDLGATGVVIAGQTLTPGGAAITTNGATISALSSGQLVIASDGTTSTASPQSNGGVLGIGNDQSATIVTVPGPVVSEVVVAGQTLTPGGSAFNLNGATVSALPSGRLVIASAGTTSTVPPQSNGVISFGNGQSATLVAIPTPGPSGIVVAGQILVPGGSPITVAGQIVSALPNGAGVLVVSDGVTSTASNGDVIGIGNGQFVTIVPVPSNAAALDEVVVAGQTLAPGGPAITSNGFTLSALPGSALLVEMGGVSSTIVFAHGGSVGNDFESGLSAAGLSIAPASGVATTLGGHTISAVLDGVVVDGTTVTASGLAQTIHGTVYSVNSDGALVVAESSTLGIGGFDGLIGAVLTAVGGMGMSVTTSSSGSENSSTKSAGSASIPGSGTSATGTVSSTTSGADSRRIAFSSVVALISGLGTVLLGL
ncbi:hypothetical protein LTR56_008272 [Elasticomyces elasticus]|nr:hypothetical protein LTR56_008272 [Elasticomyces elasticus]KAK3661835.1 hypothetical protein LTR22_007418 [Elasticomyces elasticus]KAK4924439.1 hypothetical protein LTR49_008530 [Elasticomyces elasticus]